MVGFIAQLADLQPCTIGYTCVDAVPCINDLLFGSSRVAMLQNGSNEVLLTYRTYFKSVSKSVTALVTKPKHIADILIRHQAPEGLQTANPIVLHEHTAKVEDDMFAALRHNTRLM